MDRASREKDVKIEQLKQSYEELEDKWQQATDQCLQLKQQMNEKQREHEQILRDKDAQASRSVDGMSSLASILCIDL